MWPWANGEMHKQGVQRLLELLGQSEAGLRDGLPRLPLFNGQLPVPTGENQGILANIRGS